MMTGFHGTFVISWTQTELDGLANAGADALIVGATWQWSGEAVRVDGAPDVLVLGQSEETTNLRQHAARAVHRLVGAALDVDPLERLPVPENPLLEHGFAVTDGRRTFTATLIEVPNGKPPLLMFLNDLPPRDQDLWVTHVTDAPHRPNRTGDVTPSVICFTPETWLATPDGPRLVRDLGEGDWVQTKDDGAQQIRWVGWRRMSGARLFAMPELRPVRIRAGAVGMDRPEEDLLVSPEHRMLIKGSMAQTLFNTDEVLVAARDLLNDRTIVVDRQLRQVTYVHLLLDRHQIVFANGLETESFHPGSMPLESIDEDQRAALLERVPGIDRDVSLYGPPARRALSGAEAAILRYKGKRAA